MARFTNYGTIDSSIWISNGAPGLDMFTNYGILKGGLHNETSTTILNNLGSMGWWMSKGNISVSSKGKVLIANYTLMLNENAAEFNKFNGSGDKNSHLVISGNNGSVRFKDGDSKIILGFGEKFQEGEGYLINKIATDTSGNPYSDLGVDFDRLTPKNDIYTLYKQGDYFIARLQPQHGIIGNLYKANIRTMNNFMIMSNSMIYPRKHSKSQNLWRRHSSLLQYFPSIARGNSNASPSLAEGARGWVEYPSLLNSANSLKSYESFAYRNESQTRRIQRQNKRNYSRESLKTQNLNADSANRVSKSQNQRFSQNLAQNPHDYYFILTPFVNHNYFFESGRYNLSGFDYGFLTAFSARVAESNSLGAHFAFSYGSLNDKHDKDLSIHTMNFMLGVNYKLDLIYDMFLKARGDVFYFLNTLDFATIKNIKPNNLGFGVSVSYGKDFDFKQGGVLGLEVGLDYKALKSNKVSIDSQEYQKALYNLIYADLGLNYQKYFGGFGINLGGGFKANLAPNLAKSILLANSQNLRFALDNDKYLGYANVGLSYVLNHKNFDMEFSLAYYGNYGDRVVSNGGGFEWRTTW